MARSFKGRKYLRTHLEGYEELNEALRKVSNQAGGKILRDAAREGAEVIRAEAERTAPFDRGDLARSVIQEDKKLQVGRAQISIGPHSGRAFIGRFHELGTSKMPARPWLRPAFDAVKSMAVDAVAFVLRTRLIDRPR